MKNKDKKTKELNLEDTIQGIESKFGKGSIMLLESDPQPIESISTGSMALDTATGIGGIPKGRITEIFGSESSGKTTCALHIIAEAQKQDSKKSVFVDTENSLDAEYAQKLGVDFSRLYVSQPNNAEEALNIIEDLIRSNELSVVVLDSVAALVPSVELSGAMGDANVGIIARLMSQAMRKLTPLLAKSDTALIFINQLRDKIGVMFGDPSTTTGGRALKFYASMRLDIRRIGALKAGETVIGNRTRVKVVKNKLAPPFRIAEFDLVYGKGFSKENEIIDLALQKKILKQKGAWFEYNGENLAQGKDNLSKLLASNSELMKEIYEKVKEPTEQNQD